MKNTMMKTLNKTLCLSVGAAVGAGVTYYLLKKDSPEFKKDLNNVWDETKSYGGELVNKVDDYLDAAGQEA